MKSRSENILFSLFAAFGYLLLIAYFGLMAFANLFSRDPNRLVGACAVALAVFCIWRLFCSVRRVVVKKGRGSSEGSPSDDEDEE